MTAEDYMRHAEGLPFARIGDLLPVSGTVILAPHPDDESLGCGGLLAALAARGEAARVVVMTDGARSHPGSRRYPPDRLRALRQAEACEALELLGQPEPVFLGWPDGGLPSGGPDFEEAVEGVLAQTAGCATLIATSGLDPHADHAATWAIARAAASRRGLRLLAYPVWSWRYLYPHILPIDPAETPGPPRGMRLDIGPFLAAKRRAVQAHRSQTSPLIDDDPGGFILTPEMLAVMVRPFEVYLEDAP